MNYFVNHIIHIARCLPPFLRGSKLSSFIRVVHHPLSGVNQNLVAYAFDARYFANLYPQTILFEKFLNDKHDNLQRRIKIEHYQKQGVFIGLKAESETGVFIGLKAEGETGLFVPLKVEDQTDINDANIDFKIIVPIGLPADEVVQSIELIKPASKRYLIEN